MAGVGALHGRSGQARDWLQRDSATSPIGRQDIVGSHGQASGCKGKLTVMRTWPAAA